MALEVEVRGLAELERAWPAFARREDVAVRQVAQAIAGITADQVAIRAPKRTGAFAGSVRREDSSLYPPTASVVEGEGLAYGRWLEFGKRKRGRAPRGGRYLLPTAKRQVRTLKKRAATATQQEIHRFPWPNPKP